MGDETEWSRIVSVLSFYVLSCSCYHRARRRKESNRSASTKSSAVLWQEEIQNGPHLLQRSADRLSSSNGTEGTSTPYTVPSTPVTDADLPAPEPVYLADNQRRMPPTRSTSLSVTQMPRIHPPVNERHPPVVSALPTSGDEMAWMTLPPPSVTAMKALNRFMNSQRNSTWDHTAPGLMRNGSVAGSSIISTARGSTADSAKSPKIKPMTMEMENLVASSPPRVVMKRVRYDESVLPDMEGTKSEGGALLKETAAPRNASKEEQGAEKGKRPQRPVELQKENQKQLQKEVLQDTKNPSSIQPHDVPLPEDLEKQAVARTEMAEILPPRPLSLGFRTSSFGFTGGIEKELNLEFGR